MLIESNKNFNNDSLHEFENKLNEIFNPRKNMHNDNQGEKECKKGFCLIENTCVNDELCNRKIEIDLVYFYYILGIIVIIIIILFIYKKRKNKIKNENVEYNFSDISEIRRNENRIELN